SGTGFVEHESEALPDLEAEAPPEDEELDIGVVRAEEIVLRASESTEYQVSNDADSLLNDLPVPEQAEIAPVEDETFPDEPEMGYFEEDAPHPYSPQNWDVPAGSEPPQSAEERLAGWEGSFPGGDAGGDEPPAISGESVGPMEEHDDPEVEQVPGWWSEEGGRVPEPPMAAEYVEHGPGSEQETPEEEPEAEEDLPPAAALPSDEENYRERGEGSGVQEGSGEPEEETHAGAFGITETLAEIYLAQGHHREAAEVYRQLLERNPDSGRLQEKLAGAEARVPGTGTRTERRPYSAGRSGGQSVEGYFAALLAARPAPEEPAPVVPTEESDSGPSRSPGSAAPTRPATDSLSLSAIFGEDGPESQAPQAPHHTPGAPPAAPGMSFDEFFGPGGDRPPARPSRGSAEGDEDLTQFHDWLKSLKS
ncbi:MAG: tetratricopeptide repeat protein, partial [Gemmatimonadales bacterium]